MAGVDKRRIVTWAQKRLANPVARAVLNRGVRVPGYVLLETTGRRSGLPRQVPLGATLEGDSLWVMSEYGRRSGYVRNIEANPQVRVRVDGRWRHGTAVLMPEDDPKERQRVLGRGRLSARINAVAVRAVGTDLLTVRIDLASPEPHSEG